MNTVATLATTTNDKVRWLKRAGKIGFWFFFLKGMAWMTAPLVIYYFA